MSRIKWVHQEDEYGCGFAVLAMITGKSYEAVKNDLIDCYHQGLCDETLDDYLADNGYFIARRKKNYEWKHNAGDEWKQPFAHVHLVKVLSSYDAAYCHYVVMLNDGRVFDPESANPKTLNDYVRVIWVAGITKLRKKSLKPNETLALHS